MDGISPALAGRKETRARRFLFSREEGCCRTCRPQRYCSLTVVTGESRYVGTGEENFDRDGYYGAAGVDSRLWEIKDNGNPGL